MVLAPRFALWVVLALVTHLALVFLALPKPVLLLISAPVFTQVLFKRRVVVSGLVSGPWSDDVAVPFLLQWLDKVLNGSRLSRANEQCHHQAAHPGQARAHAVLSFLFLAVGWALHAPR